jgi:hypothetical protein
VVAGWELLGFAVSHRLLLVSITVAVVLPAVKV